MSTREGAQLMTMTYRSNVLALFVSLPMLAACPINGDLGDGANDDAGDDGDGDGDGDGGVDADAGDDDDDDDATDAGDDDDDDDDDDDATDAGDDDDDDDDDDAVGCTEEDCGPAPGAPNYLCDDGVTWGGPGGCGELEDGSCGWDWVECPTCCYEADMPPCIEGASCCADGSWACNEGDGSSTCPDGEGTVCGCCDPAEEDAMGCIEGASCCADGTWACNDGGGGSTCESAGVVCSGGGGQCADDGMSCAGGETCCDGLQCCSGVPVPPGDEYCSAMCPISDRNRKENFELVDPKAVLDQLLAVPITTWSYKFEDSSIRHIGPMAQDFKAMFRVGATDKAIYTVDADGVALASIKALHGELETLRTENDELKSALAAMQERLEALEAK